MCVGGGTGRNGPYHSTYCSLIKSLVTAGLDAHGVQLCFRVDREKELAQLSELEMLKREGEVARIKAEAQAKEEAERRMEQVNLRAIKVGQGYRPHHGIHTCDRSPPMDRREGRCNMRLDTVGQCLSDSTIVPWRYTRSV